MSKRPSPNATHTLTFKVQGITCSNCIAHIEKVLAGVPDIISSQVNQADESVRIEFDTENPAPRVSVAIEGAGYQIKEVSLSFEVSGMSCASCARAVEKALERSAGILSATVNLATETATVKMFSCVDIDELLYTIDKAGYQGKIANPNITTQGEEPKPPSPRDFLIGTCLSTPLLASMILMIFGVHWTIPVTWQWALSTPVQFYLGLRFYKAAWQALRARRGNMDLLVALGTSAAYGISVYELLYSSTQPPHLYFESSCVVITLILLGKWLEARAKWQMTDAIRALQALRPSTARILESHNEQEVSYAQIKIGDILIVRPGERLPVDGVITDGVTELDESMLTGESQAVLREIGDKVTGGAINGTGRILVRATRIGRDSTLAHIIRMVQDAQATKSPTQKLVDKISAVFVPVVLILAFSTFLAWFYESGKFEIALINAVAVLVIACPCALGLATPAAVMTGVSVAARHGILIKDALALEIMHRINTIAFDKTGTLTIGKPRVVTVYSPKLSETDFMRIAASLAKASEHPLSQAILHHMGSTDLPLLPTSTFKALPGRGVSAQINGMSYALGNTQLMQELGLDISNFETSHQKFTQNGASFSWLACLTDLIILGLIVFSDPIKPGAANAIAQLHSQGIETIMISGDNLAAAQTIAKQLGITQVYAQTLPADKAAHIIELRKQNHVVAMVGDGINDAPALTAADIGIAMASGTDIAMNSAGVTLMRGDISLISDSMDISRRTYFKIRQNLFWAFIYNIVGIPLAAVGLLSPVIAGAAMAFSSVSVLANALLLNRWRPLQKLD